MIQIEQSKIQITRFEFNYWIQLFEFSDWNLNINHSDFVSGGARVSARSLRFRCVIMLLSCYRTCRRNRICPENVRNCVSVTLLRDSFYIKASPKPQSLTVFTTFLCFRHRDLHFCAFRRAMETRLQLLTLKSVFPVRCLRRYRSCLWFAETNGSWFWGDRVVNDDLMIKITCEVESILFWPFLFVTRFWDEFMEAPSRCLWTNVPGRVVKKTQRI